jgi:hypothetical protein
VLGRPLTGTQLVENVSTIAGNPHPYRWVTGHSGTTESGNTANGVAAPLCQGTEPPRSAFIFVIAVAPMNPDGTPPPPPADLKMPVLGGLPPCAPA